ncbi:MAG: hypothetical protein QXF25_03065 [Candidatus Pacearchaeota archaeon]
MKNLILITMGFLLLCSSCSENKKEKLKKENDSKQLQAIDTMTRLLVKIISGEAGEVRDWKRFKNLFIPGATLTGIYYTANTHSAVTLTIDEYINLADRKFMESSFYEMEFNKTTEIFGNIAHVFQVFISSESKGYDTKKRGINSIHLIYDKGRWWITNVIWDYETPSNRIPSKYIRDEHREILPS